MSEREYFEQFSGVSLTEIQDEDEMERVGELTRNTFDTIRKRLNQWANARALDLDDASAYPVLYRGALYYNKHDLEAAYKDTE